jgi:hypothetical protein
VIFTADVNKAPVASHAFTVMVWPPLAMFRYVFSELWLVLYATVLSTYTQTALTGAPDTALATTFTGECTHAPAVGEVTVTIGGFTVTVFDTDEDSPLLSVTVPVTV